MKATSATPLIRLPSPGLVWLEGQIFGCRRDRASVRGYLQDAAGESAGVRAGAWNLRTNSYGGKSSTRTTLGDIKIAVGSPLQTAWVV
jgi:hypothetical protein